MPEEVPAVASSSSSSASTASSAEIVGGVPSIIIQDSFIVEEPSLSSVHQQPPSAPVPKPRRDPSPHLPTTDAPTADVVPPPTKPRRFVGEEPEARPPPASGEDADDAWPRMSVKPVPPSFPVASDHNEERLSALPVPKPRKSPLPPDSPPQQPPAALPRRNFFVPEEQPVKAAAYFPSLNPFEDDDEEAADHHDEPAAHSESPVSDTGNATYLTQNRPPSVRLEDVEEEEVLSEDSVCQMLEKAIEDHDAAPIQLRAITPEIEDHEEEEESKTPTSADKSMDLSIDDNGQSEKTLDLFNNASAMEISPVEKASGTVDKSLTTPVQEVPGEIGRARGFFSTPRHVPETPMDHNVSVVKLDWMEASDDSDSQGFGGSVEGQSRSSNAGQAAASAAAVTTKTLDSAIETAAADEEAFDSPLDLEAAKSRRISYFLPRHDDVFTPPSVVALPVTDSTPANALSTPAIPPSTGKRDLSWDNYDMELFPSPKLQPGRRSMVPEDPAPVIDLSPLGNEEMVRRKRISLDPCLKGLTLGTPFSDATGSPFTEDEEGEEEEEEKLAGKLLLAIKTKIDRHKMLPTLSTNIHCFALLLFLMVFLARSYFSTLLLQLTGTLDCAILLLCMAFLAVPALWIVLFLCSCLLNVCVAHFVFPPGGNSNANNETQRMKMASTFHQRVVVGEDKPVNNNAPRDHHALRDSPSSEDRQNLYQGRTREVFLNTEPTKKKFIFK